MAPHLLRDSSSDHSHNLCKQVISVPLCPMILAEPSQSLRIN